MYIDTHCHLQWSDFDTDRAMVIGNAKKAGVKQFIVPGVDENSSVSALHIAKNNPGVVFAAIGFHPYEGQKNNNLRMLEENTANVVAIGEIGLDYHLYKGEVAESKKNSQKHLFLSQLNIALAHQLPVIMHCRDAYEDFFDILDSLPMMPHGVIHCFSGSLQELRFAKERNLYVGLDGNLTYSKQLQIIAKDIPLSMLLLETDTPYLTPIPHRGTRNEPKYIPLIAQKIAELQNKSREEIEIQTTANAQTLFRLSRGII